MYLKFWDEDEDDLGEPMSSSNNGLYSYNFFSNAYPSTALDWLYQRFDKACICLLSVLLILRSWNTAFKHVHRWLNSTILGEDSFPQSHSGLFNRLLQNSWTTPDPWPRVQYYLRVVRPAFSFNEITFYEVSRCWYRSIDCDNLGGIVRIANFGTR